VTDKANPVTQKVFNDYDAEELCKVGNYIYGIGDDKDPDYLRVFNVSDPENVPDPVSIPLSDSHTVCQIDHQKGFLYIAHQDVGLHVYSILNDPAIPEYVTTWEIDSPRVVHFDSGLLYLGAYDSHSLKNWGVEIYDTNDDPIAPPHIGHWCDAVLFTPYDIAVVGNYAYVSGRDGPFGSPEGIIVLDISDPGNIQRVGFLEIEDVNKIFNDGPVIFACVHGTLHVIL
jgi:hypothetical protein